MHLKEVGFEGIDIDQRVDHADVRRAREETGLIVHGVVDYDHWKLPLSHPDARSSGSDGLESLEGIAPRCQRVRRNDRPARGGDCQ